MGVRAAAVFRAPTITRFNMGGGVRTLPQRSGFTPVPSLANTFRFRTDNREFRRLFRNSYWYGNPYAYGYGYGGYGYGGSGYGDGSGYGSGYANPYYADGSSSGYGSPYAAGYGSSTGGVNPGQGSGGPSTETIFAAAGVPAEWPLGLRILPGVDPLRQRIEGLYQVAAAQALTGTLNPALPGQIKSAVKQLERLVARDKHDRLTLTTAMYEEAGEFLRQLAQATPRLAALEFSNPYASAHAVSGSRK
jgi:hypothetical protein